MKKGKKDRGVVSRDLVSGEKSVHTFRLPDELVAAMREEGERGGYGLTGLLVRLMNGLLTDFGLPSVATRLLDQDREALGVDRYQYLANLLLERSYQLRQRGVGFDRPVSTGRKDA